MHSPDNSSPASLVLEASFTEGPSVTADGRIALPGDAILQDGIPLAFTALIDRYEAEIELEDPESLPLDLALEDVTDALQDALEREIQLCRRQFFEGDSPLPLETPAIDAFWRWKEVVARARRERLRERLCEGGDETTAENMIARLCGSPSESSAAAARAGTPAEIPSDSVAPRLSSTPQRLKAVLVFEAIQAHEAKRRTNAARRLALSLHSHETH